jgi:hypothetical protein
MKKWSRRFKCKTRKRRMECDPIGCGRWFKIDWTNLFWAYWIGAWGIHHHYPAVCCPNCGNIRRVRPPLGLWLRMPRKVEHRIFDGFDDRDPNDDRVRNLHAGDNWKR